MSSRVCVTEHRKDPVPLVDKSVLVKGFLLDSFIHQNQIIIITGLNKLYDGLNKLYDRLFSP